MSLTRWHQFLMAGRTSTGARPRPLHRLLLERLEDRTLLNGHTLAMATPLELSPDHLAAASGSLPSTDIFAVTVAETGRLTAQVHATSADTRLSLLGPDGRLLIQSDGQSATNLDDQIIQHLVPGTYYLEVEALGIGTGTYTLTTDFLPASTPLQPIPVGNDDQGNMVTGDLNGDGIADLVSVSRTSEEIAVRLGLGDGTFQENRTVKVGLGHLAVALADFNRDGRSDLVLANVHASEVTVLLGRGDGTFQQPMRIGLGTAPFDVATGDFNGDGIVDLATANRYSNDVSLLLGWGDGTFQNQVQLAEGNEPIQVVPGDFNGDGRLDLATANFTSNDISVLLGRGDGTFQNPGHVAVGAPSDFFVTGDFNNDRRLDLVALHRDSGTISVFLGRGDGTFQEPVRFEVGSVAWPIATGDLNRDGRLDLVSSNVEDVSVFLGLGDGTFAKGVRYTAGELPSFILTADFDGDGWLDLAFRIIPSNAFVVLLGRGDGTFPNQGRAAVGYHPQDMASGDFNGDGRLDLAAAIDSGGGILDGVWVFMGLGDGMFQQPILMPGSRPGNLVTGDFNSDGRLDIANQSDETILVFRGNGNGTFQSPLQSAGGQKASSLIQGDFNSDGRLDLATANPYSDNISVMLGRGDGTFETQVQYAVGRLPWDVITADFTGDGRLDLATANPGGDDDLSLLVGRGDGTFQDPVSLAAPGEPVSLATADFNGDGRADLAAYNYVSSDVSVLLGLGGGAFQPPQRFAAGTPFSSTMLVTGDFNNDSHLDLATLNYFTSQISVLLGRGDGSFQEQVSFAVGNSPFAVLPGDFNDDGRQDLVITNNGSWDVSLLLGKGDGTFQHQLRFAVGANVTSTSLATGDFNSDGRRDVVAVRPNSNDAAIFLGRGDGTLPDPLALRMGNSPVSVVTGDFNRDGRLDLATANYGSADVAVSLGLGDGTYQDGVHFSVGTRPISLVLGDFNGDGRLDLATANSGSNDVSVYLGRGDGTFRNEVRLVVGTVPEVIITGDFNGDGRLDLATANYLSQDVSLLFGRGDGTFQIELRLPVGPAPVSLVQADFNRDGRPDLAVANLTSNQIGVFLSRADGSFQEPLQFTAGALPRALTVADFNGDGMLDLATANNNSNDISILLGRGDGTFQNQVRYPAGKYPFFLVADDVNSDGRLDLVTADQLGTETSILLGLGDGTFVTPDTVANTIRSSPLVADLNGDGTADVAVVNRAGEILLRLGRAGAPGAFEPPVVVNPDSRFATRDLALVSTAHGQLLAALDARSSSVSFYSRGAGGAFTRTSGFAVPGTLPVRLAARDLNGDGLGDLVVLTGGSTQALVYLQVPHGVFGLQPDYQIGVGLIPSDLALVDVDGDQRPDIVVTNQFSGDVSVISNDPLHPFSSEQRLRAGTGLYYIDDANGTLVVRSGEGTAGVVADTFDADSLGEVIVSNSGSNSFSVLQATTTGGLFNPQKALTFATGIQPTIVAVGRFNSDLYLDLAVFNQGSDDISIFLGDGSGGFAEKVARDASGNKLPINAGNLPTGLAVHDVNGDGRLDLLIGNEFGDVLTLLGNGDGTFQPYQRADRNIALAVADLNGDGKPDFLFANEALDRVSVQYSQAGQRFTQDRSNGLLAPGAVSTADLNDDRIPDLVVANTGGNNVLVYLGTGNSEFGPAHTFFAGTNPAAITIQDLNDDGLPDLVVANEGSNDVTLLLGQDRGSSWTLTPGPRVQSGGQGPVSTVVQDVTGPGHRPDGIPDLIVTNSQSNTVSIIPGVGQGFFDDRNPDIFQTGIDPRQALVGNFDGTPGLDLVTINAGSNDLTFFSNFGPGRSLSSGGATPVKALTQDVNGDGLSDMLVANNGDGRIALLLGEEGGISLAQTYSRADVPHPTALALAVSNAALQLYVTDESRESAILLTSFGIPISFTDRDTQRRLLTDVFLVNGPGFASGLDLIAPSGEPVSGPGVEPATPSVEEGEPAGQASGRPAEGTPLVATLLLGAGQDAAALIADTPGHPDPIWTDFVIGVDSALHPPAPEESEDTEVQGPVSVQGSLAAIDRVFRDWLPTVTAEMADTGVPLADSHGLLGAGSVDSSTVEFPGEVCFPRANPHFRTIVERLFQAGSAATSALGDFIRLPSRGDAPGAMPARSGLAAPAIPESSGQGRELPLSREEYSEPRPEGDEDLPAPVGDQTDGVLIASKPENEESPIKPVAAVFLASGLFPLVLSDVPAVGRVRRK
jgi:hypothetical protein